MVGAAVWELLLPHSRLLLENSVQPAIHTLRKHKNYRVPFVKTSRFKNSFLLYAVFSMNICNLH